MFRDKDSVEECVVCVRCVALSQSASYSLVLRSLVLMQSKLYRIEVNIDVSVLLVIKCFLFERVSTLMVLYENWWREVICYCDKIVSTLMSLFLHMHASIHYE